MHAIENIQGFTLARLTSDHCSVAVIPALGAKIVSLVDLRTKREWMWHPPGPLRLWRNREGAPFSDSTFVGADECLPTIEPCIWRGRELPDHGEVWSAEWRLDEDCLSDGVIRTSTLLPRSPFLFERSVTLNESVVRLDYRLTNTGSESESWLWALHPLLSFELDDRLELPPEVQQMRVYLAKQPVFPPGTVLKWPEPAPGINLHELRLAGDDAYLKSFAIPLQEGRARIANSRTNDSLTFTWDVLANPCLGIWLTRGGFNGWHHPAIEPTNASTDCLADAARENAMPTIAQGATKTWHVELLVGKE
jgi:hypothetical protein